MTEDENYFLAIKDILTKITDRKLLIDNELKEKLRNHMGIIYTIVYDTHKNDRKKLVQSRNFLYLLLPIIKQQISSVDFDKNVYKGGLKQEK